MSIHMLTFEKKKTLTIQATLEIFSGAEWRWEWAWLCPWWATCQEEDADHDDHDDHNDNDNSKDGYDDNNDHGDDNVIRMNEWMWREKKLPHAGK